MQKKLEEKLLKKYPLLFNLPYGFEHGDGWYNLLDSLCKEVTEYLESDFLSVAPKAKGFKFTQTKEKFGFLTIYTSVSNDLISSLIRSYVEQSGKICENCSSIKDVETKTIDGWIKTRCKECFKKNK